MTNSICVYLLGVQELVVRCTVRQNEAVSIPFVKIRVLELQVLQTAWSFVVNVESCFNVPPDEREQLYFAIILQRTSLLNLLKQLLVEGK